MITYSAIGTHRCALKNALCLRNAFWHVFYVMQAKSRSPWILTGRSQRRNLRKIRKRHSAPCSSSLVGSRIPFSKMATTHRSWGIGYPIKAHLKGWLSQGCQCSLNKRKRKLKVTVFLIAVMDATRVSHPPSTYSLQLILGTHDFFGLNHYTTQLVSYQDMGVKDVSYERDQDLITTVDPSWRRY